MKESKFKPYFLWLRARQELASCFWDLQKDIDSSAMVLKMFRTTKLMGGGVEVTLELRPTEHSTKEGETMGATVSIRAEGSSIPTGSWFMEMGCGDNPVAIESTVHGMHDELIGYLKQIERETCEHPSLVRSISERTYSGAGLYTCPSCGGQIGILARAVQAKKGA